MQRHSKRYFPIFVLPTLAAFTLAFVIPFLWGIFLSFTRFLTVIDYDFVGIENYVGLITDKKFISAFWFTGKFAVVSVLTINIFAFLLALLLTRKVKGTNLFRTIFFMPNLIGGIVLGYIWMLILNGILANFGVTLTFASKFGFWGLIILLNWQQVGYMMVIYIAGIQNIPSDIMEAAKIDGAGRFQMLKKITLPLVMPSITICTFLTVSNSFKLFDQNLALTNGMPSNKSTMLALDIFNTFYGTPGHEGMGQAKAVVFCINVSIITLLSLKFTRSKEVDN